jgi:hypothetical protein
MTRVYRSRELNTHKAILSYLRLALPHAITHHSAQNFGIEGDAIKRAVALAKAMGMVSGWPDLVTLYNGKVMGWEVKAEGGTVSDAQKTVGAAFIANGAHWAVVRSIDDVKQYLAEWGIE